MNIEQEMEAYSLSLKAALAWGDYKEAYRIEGEMDRLEQEAVIANLGQKTVTEALAVYPTARVKYGRYGGVTLEIDDWDYSPNLHDSGMTMGWKRVRN